MRVIIFKIWATTSLAFLFLFFSIVFANAKVLKNPLYSCIDNSCRSQLELTGEFAQSVIRKLENNLKRPCSLRFDYVNEPEINMVILLDHGRSIANLDYDIENGVLTSGFAHVDPPYREVGIATLLFERIISTHPEIKIIKSGRLVQTNIYEIEDAINDGASIIEALRETPAYKLRARLGFSEIIPDSIDPNTFSFSVRKPIKPLPAR
jgi:hypothetical protein